MKPPVFFKTLKDRYVAVQSERRQVAHRCSDAQNMAKRAIFAMHRHDMKGAQTLLQDASRLLSESETILKKFSEIAREGIYQAAVEEYAEARLFEQFLTSGGLAKGEARIMSPETYFAALSDATGELVRYALREATNGNMPAVGTARQTVEMAIEFLLSMDLTGYQRQKFDQAKRNLRSLEQIQYETRLKG